MSVVEPPQTCPACGNAVTPEAAFCKTCGGPLQPNVRQSLPRSARWYHNIWFVLLMISPFVLGPFGLPLLWKSPRFSHQVKIWLTVFTAAWTVLAVWYIIAVAVPAIMNTINQFNSTLAF